jgi:hypothetical protein
MRGCQAASTSTPIWMHFVRSRRRAPSHAGHLPSHRALLSHGDPSWTGRAGRQRIASATSRPYAPALAARSDGCFPTAPAQHCAHFYDTVTGCDCQPHGHTHPAGLLGRTFADPAALFSRRHYVFAANVRACLESLGVQRATRSARRITQIWRPFRGSYHLFAARLPLVADWITRGVRPRGSPD